MILKVVLLEIKLMNQDKFDLLKKGEAENRLE